MIQHSGTLVDCLHFHSFDKYYMPLVEIKYFDALIDNKPFFDQPVKINKKCMENLLKYQKMMTIQQGIY